MAQCINCGAPLRDSAKFCSKCGVKQPTRVTVESPELAESTHQPQVPAVPRPERNIPVVNPFEENEEPKKSKAPVVVGILVVLACAVAAAVFMNRNDGTSSTDNQIKQTVSTASVVKGSMTDSRDGNTYETVKIGDQVWMAENLNYETANSWCLDNKSKNCRKYGRLYTWNDARMACPGGWHLPSNVEFETLLNAVGGLSTAGKMLKSTRGWLKVNGSWEESNGIDAYSFAALPAGWRYYESGWFSREGYYAYFWSSTEYKNNCANTMGLFNESGNGRFDGGVSADLGDEDKRNAFSVRCIKD